ncbi:MAG TPA: hypothetical protein VHK24_01775, partial [Steroidobacter sp.]|nr:hypothetical protein [Steroidobacter sp.]
RGSWWIESDAERDSDVDLLTQLPSPTNKRAHGGPDLINVFAATDVRARLCPGDRSDRGAD